MDLARKVANFARELADREAIRDCLARYSRGADRVDRAGMESAYWPDATDEHGGIYEGSASGLIEQMMPLLRQLDRTTHYISNNIIEIIDHEARSESYVLAYYTMSKEPDPATNIIVGARYLDKLAKRDDEWRILHRNLVIDWVKTMIDPVDAVPSPVNYAILGRRIPEDPSTEFFQSQAVEAR